MVSTQRILLTSGGVKLIKERINALKKELALVRSQKGEAADTGGNAWHDNAAFEGLELRERTLIQQIQREGEKLVKAQVIDEKKTHNAAKVQIGSRVTIVYADGEKAIFTIVGSGEGDPPSGKVAYDAPLGTALMGAKAGDKRQLELDDHKEEIIIESVDR